MNITSLVFGILIIAIIFTLLNRLITQDAIRKQKKMQELCATGATVFLGKIWGIPQRYPDDQPQGMNQDPNFTINHLEGLIQSGEKITGVVCGETISTTISQRRGAPYHARIFVIKTETEKALCAAHQIMCTQETRTLMKIPPLDLDISVTG